MAAMAQPSSKKPKRRFGKTCISKRADGIGEWILQHGTISEDGLLRLTHPRIRRSEAILSGLAALRLGSLAHKHARHRAGYECESGNGVDRSGKTKRVRNQTC